MGNSHQAYGAFSGPTLEDCERLWTTIVKELVSDAEIKIRLRVLPLGQVRPAVLVTSPGYDAEAGCERRHVWATTDVSNASVAITYATLHQLLFRAYHNMEAALGGQQGFWDDSAEE